MYKVYLLDDEPFILEGLKYIVDWQNYGFEIVGFANNGEDGLKEILSMDIDLVITDIMMPKMNGYELVRELRESKYNIPILLVTAKDKYQDKEEGFLLVADDYMVKPIDIKEMLLRVRVLLKRANLANESKLKIGKLVLDYKDLSVVRDSKDYILAQKEFYLLYKLLSTPDRVFSRQELMEEIWGMENESDFRTVDVHIKRIREKMQRVPEFEIITVRNVGYKAIIKEGEQ